MLTFAQRARRLLWPALILVLLLAACDQATPATPTAPPATATNLPDLPTATSEPAAPTATAAPADPTATPEAAPTAPPVPLDTGVLPAPVYYLSSGNQQVYRLARDGVTTTQISSEPVAVTAYDVNPAANLLAYIADNDVYLLDLAGGTRTLKFDGPTLTDDDPNRFLNSVSSVALSPDGGTLAFTFQGVQTVPTAGDAAPTMVLPSDPAPDFSDPDFVFPEGPIRFHYGVDWSPTGGHWLVSFGYFPEAGGIGLYDLASGSFTDLSQLASGAVGCCEFSWFADGSGGVISSDILVYGQPGLSRVDVAGPTVTPIIAPADAPPFRLLRSAWPAPDGSVLTFLAEASEYFDAPFYQMTRVVADGSTLPVGEFPPYLQLGTDVLWAADGRGVIAGERQYGSAWDAPGSYRFYTADGNAAFDLPLSGHALQWGGPPETSTAVTPDDLAALRAQAIDEFGVTTGESGTVSDVITRRVLAAGRVLYVAHSVGMHSYDPPSGHFVGLYEWTGSSWNNLSYIDFSAVGSSDGSSPIGLGPDYLGDGSVRQAFIDPADIWLLVDGGVGAHGGLTILLRYTPADGLSVLASNGSGSPGAGYVEDVNGDGAQELIFDYSDYYVFCYACGVSLQNRGLLRWNGSALEEVLLTPLSAGDPAVTAAVNSAIALAEAGLWQDAEFAVRPLRNTSDPAARWQIELILLTAQARAVASDSPFPVLSRFFYGDYPSATFALADYELADLFNPAGSWITGSVAEGWMESWYPYIVEMTTRALAQQPDNGGAYFMRGWAKYLIDASDASAIADVVQAANLQPDNVLYPPAAAYLQSLP